MRRQFSISVHHMMVRLGQPQTYPQEAGKPNRKIKSPENKIKIKTEHIKTKSLSLSCWFFFFSVGFVPSLVSILLLYNLPSPFSSSYSQSPPRFLSLLFFGNFSFHHCFFFPLFFMLYLELIIIVSTVPASRVSFWWFACFEVNLGVLLLWIYYRYMLHFGVYCCVILFC